MKKNMKKITLFFNRVFVSLILILVPVPGFAFSLGEMFIDPSDGHIDMSKWLMQKQGFLPVPIIITEPAIGNGLGMAGIYFHDNLANEERVPPSISALAGAKTSNGTWFAGGGHLGYWAKDTIRYTGGLGKGVIQMDYYGLSGVSGKDLESGISFETDAVFFVQELQFRLADSNFFAGAGYYLIDTGNTFDWTGKLEELGVPEINFDSRSAAAGLMLNYDNLNNILTPSKGIDAEINGMFFNETWGSDQNFQRYNVLISYYTKPVSSLVVLLRSAASSVRGESPFYAVPFVQLRGVKAMQFQGEETLKGETELRWSFTPRWALVGFAGVGKAFNEGIKGDSDNIYTKGLGMRYLIASKLGLQAGVDIAKGPEDTAFYIIFGHSI